MLLSAVSEIFHIYWDECGGDRRVGGGGAVWADDGVYRERGWERGGGLRGMVGGSAVAVASRGPPEGSIGPIGPIEPIPPARPG